MTKSIKHSIAFQSAKIEAIFTTSNQNRFQPSSLKVSQIKLKLSLLVNSKFRCERSMSERNSEGKEVKNVFMRPKPVSGIGSGLNTP